MAGGVYYQWTFSFLVALDIRFSATLRRFALAFTDGQYGRGTDFFTKRESCALSQSEVVLFIRLLDSAALFLCFHVSDELAFTHVDGNCSRDDRGLLQPHRLAHRYIGIYFWHIGFCGLGTHHAGILAPYSS